jgi:hypothetical protein
MTASTPICGSMNKRVRLPEWRVVKRKSSPAQVLGTVRAQNAAEAIKLVVSN